MTIHDIAGKLWNLRSVLKDDGVTYHRHVTELRKPHQAPERR
jgi:hypothetical protein